MDDKKPAHRAYEVELKKSAEQALDEIPEGDKKAARTSRAQLYNWLVGMDHNTKNPALLINDDMADTACQAMEAFIKQQGKKKIWKELSAAFGALSDDEQLNLFRYAIGAVLQNHTLNSALMSRSSDLFLWENTGFHADGEIKCVFAKIGRDKFQPIGFDDGEMYIGTEGSKTLWFRQFAMALMFPYPAPFKIDVAEVTPQRVSDDLHISDKEREKINEILGYFDEDLDAWSKLGAEDKKARNELEFKMRETLKLACIRLPRLDKKLDEFKDEHPQVGGNFENVNIWELVYSCREFLSMKLDDDAVRRQVESTTLLIGDETEQKLKLLTTLADGLGKLIPPEGEAPDADALEGYINQVVRAFPSMQEVLDDLGEQDLLSAGQALLTVLQKQIEETEDSKK